VSFYLNAYRVIISLYGTACCGQQINHFRFARILFAVLQTRSLLLATVCCAFVIHSEYNEVTRQNEPHTYSIQFTTHRRQIMRRYVVAAPLREKVKVKVNFSLSTRRRRIKYTAPLILTTAIDCGKWSISRPDRSTPRNSPGTHRIGRQVGRRAGPNCFGEEKPYYPCRDSNPGQSKP